MDSYTVTVIIPVYKPDEKFRRLMNGLKRQTYPIKEILIMNTEKEYWKYAWIQGIENVRVEHLKKEEFDHGGTRARAAAMSTGIYWYFLHRMQCRQMNMWWKNW